MKHTVSHLSSIHTLQNLWIVLVHLHMLAEVIVPTELLSAAWIRAPVRLLVRMDASDVALEMLPSRETFPTSTNVTKIDASAQRCVSLTS